MTVYAWMMGSVLGFAALAGPLASLLQDLFVFNDRGERRALTNFYDEARVRGLTIQQAQDQLEIREYIARARRVASDRVHTAPENWFMIITEVKHELLSELARMRPDLALKLNFVFEHSSYADLLYPAEVSMVDALPVPTPTSKIGMRDDLYAALTISR